MIKEQLLDYQGIKLNKSEQDLRIIEQLGNETLKQHHSSSSESVSTLIRLTRIGMGPSGAAPGAKSGGGGGG